MFFQSILETVLNNKTRTICGVALLGVVGTYSYMLAG